MPDYSIFLWNPLKLYKILKKKTVGIVAIVLQQPDSRTVTLEFTIVIQGEYVSFFNFEKDVDSPVVSKRSALN